MRLVLLFCCDFSGMVWVWAITNYEQTMEVAYFT